MSSEPPTMPAREAVRAEAAVDDDERREWRGLPELAWDSAAPFAAALGLTTRSGRILLRQALTMAHRMPRTFRHWSAGRIETRPVKLTADAIAGQPDDVCAWVDTQVALRIRRGQAVGPVIAQRLVDEALTVLHAEELELDRQQQLLARYAQLVAGPGNADARPGPDVHGLAEFAIRGDWPDVRAFDDAIAALAEALRVGDGPEASEPLDVRRSIAVGVIADPARAAAMLGLTSSNDRTDAVVEDRPTRTSPRVQKILVALHLAADAVVGIDSRGKPWLTSTIHEWAARDDLHVFVRPVVHCGGCAECDLYCADRHQRHTYETTSLDRELVEITNPHCVFPYCTMPARRADCDHIVPFDPRDPDATPTCARCNLAPLCRHHHRLKTHAGWRYRQIEPGVHTWAEPHGQTFVTNRWGTRDTTESPVSA